MECPHCKAPLRIIEPLDAAPRYVRLFCPENACRKSIVVERTEDGASLLTVSQAQPIALRLVRSAQVEVRIASAAIRVALLLTGIVVAWALLDPRSFPMLILGIGVIAVLLVYAVATAFDVRFGVQAWFGTLPIVTAVCAETYR